MIRLLIGTWRVERGSEPLGAAFECFILSIDFALLNFLYSFISLSIYFFAFRPT